MKIRPIIISRRQVLRGAGGFTLGVPFLASLATPRGSLAAVATPMRKRFVAGFTGHGGLGPETVFWDQATPRKEMLFPGHTISAGDLAPRTEGGKVVVSNAIQIPQDILSERLLRKMNVYRALDIPFFTDHTTGCWLGNFARTGDPSEFRGQDPRQTIDNVLGWSNTFYGSLDGIRERVVQMGTMNWENEFSWRYSNPSTRSGSLVAVRAQQDPGRVWDTLFRDFTPPAPGMAAPAAPPPAKPIVDLVIEDYRRLKQGNTRLSAQDKQRLDDHLDRLAELERKVGTLRESPASGRSCGHLPARSALGCGGGSQCLGDPRK